MLECLGYWEKKMVGDPVWEDISLKIKKYKPFIKYDSTKIKQRLVDIFREE
jgi:hypothetical protein